EISQDSRGRRSVSGMRAGGFGHLEQVHPDTGEPAVCEAQFSSDLVGNVKLPAGNVGAAVINTDDGAAVRLQIHDANHRTQRQGLVGGCLAVHVVDFAIGSQLSVELSSVPTGQADEALQRRRMAVGVDSWVRRCQRESRERMACRRDRSAAFETRTSRTSSEQNQSYNNS